MEKERVTQLIESIRRSVPPQLQALPQWVCWHYEPRAKRDGSPDKPAKIPMNPLTWKRAKPNDPQTWGTLVEAAAMAEGMRARNERTASGWIKSGDKSERAAGEASRRTGYVGLGFMFDGKQFGVDLDHVCGEGGKLSDIACDILQRMNSYAEYSPSGTGIHILCAGSITGGRGRRCDSVEVYGAGRFFTVTGQPVGDALPLADGSEAVTKLIADYIDKPSAKSSATPPAHKREAPTGAPTGVGLSDSDIIIKAKTDKNGARFTRLWAGDCVGYPSQSEADLSLCNTLAFYTGKDAARVDSLFRQSGLFREEKWDEQHGALTYGDMTIKKAIEGTTNTYKPKGAARDMQGYTVPETASRFEPYASAYRQTGEYYADDGRITVMKSVNSGSLIPQVLSNFAALIVSEVTKDDGASLEKDLLIEGIQTTGHRLPSCRVPVGEFAGMNWALKQWGAEAVIQSGQATKDRVRCAIQSASVGRFNQRTVYTHTGWRKLEGGWTYLHAGGAVGVDGVEVSLSARLLNYALSQETGDRLEAVRASTGLLAVLPERIAVPLLCFMYLAPLCDAFERAGCSVDFTLFLTGATGAGKTVAATLGLAHFGAGFDGTHVPADFNTTAKDVQLSAFEMKDAPLLVDNYIPCNNAIEQRKLEAMVQTLLQAWSSRIGRNRLNQNGSHQASRPPRGCGMMTGEVMPRLNESDLARAFEVRVHPDEIDKGAALTAAQGSAREGKLARAMRGFIEYLIPRMDSLPDDLRREFLQQRDRAQIDLSGAHARQAGAIAHMLCAARVMLDYWVEAGAMNHPQSVERWEQYRKILIDAASEQASAIRDEKPERVFFRTLAGLVSAGEAVLRNVKDTEAWTYGERHVGLWDSEYAYLEYQAAFELVCEAQRRMGGHFPLTMSAFTRRLTESGAVELGEGRNVQRKVHGKRALWVKSWACPELLEAADDKYTRKKLG